MAYSLRNIESDGRFQSLAMGRWNEPMPYSKRSRSDMAVDEPDPDKIVLRSEIIENKDSSHEEGLDSLDMSVLSRELRPDSRDIGLGRSGQVRKPIGNRSSGKFPKRRQFNRRLSFGWFDYVTSTSAIFLFFFDIVTDINVAWVYYKEEMWVYAGITTVLIVGPSLVTCFVGLHFYLGDLQDEKTMNKQAKLLNEESYATPRYIWVLRFVFTILQCGPVIRSAEYMIYGYKSQNKKLTVEEQNYYFKMLLYGDVDAGLLRLFESFLEAAPQLTWQLYLFIVLKPEDDVIGSFLRATGLLTSWGSLALSLVSYHRSLRNSMDEKDKMKWKSLPFYCLWRAAETGGRVLCIAMFASVFENWVFAILLGHWIFMSFWQKTSFYKNRKNKKIAKCLETILTVICGYVMIFCFLNMREGHTRFRCLLYYFICYVENFFMLGLWFRFTPDLGAWFHLGGFCVVLIAFVLHIVFQIVYYKWFHPSEKIKLCLPCNSYVIYSSLCGDIEERHNEQRKPLK